MFKFTFSTISGVVGSSTTSSITSEGVVNSGSILTTDSSLVITSSFSGTTIVSGVIVTISSSPPTSKLKFGISFGADSSFPNSIFTAGANIITALLSPFSKESKKSPKPLILTVIASISSSVML